MITIEVQGIKESTGLMTHSDHYLVLVGNYFLFILKIENQDFRYPKSYYLWSCHQQCRVSSWTWPSASFFRKQSSGFKLKSIFSSRCCIITTQQALGRSRPTLTSNFKKKFVKIILQITKNQWDKKIREIYNYLNVYDRHTNDVSEVQAAWQVASLKAFIVLSV